MPQFINTKVYIPYLLNRPKTVQPIKISQIATTVYKQC